MYILQYNHDEIQKKSQTTYTNLFPFEENGAQFQEKKHELFSLF